jgi:hypothetical protein
MALVANRALSIGGEVYQPGEEVGAIDSDKAQQLIAQRLLRDTTLSAPKRCVAMRAGLIEGRPYKRGDLVDVSRMRSGKLSQMLEHRILDLT